MALLVTLHPRDVISGQLIKMEDRVPTDFVFWNYLAETNTF